MKKYLISLAIKEMQIKTSLTSYQCRKQTTNAGKDGEWGGTLLEG
jgi:hypothetical protein